MCVRERESERERVSHIIRGGIIHTKRQTTKEEEDKRQKTKEAKAVRVSFSLV